MRCLLAGIFNGPIIFRVQCNRISDSGKCIFALFSLLLISFLFEMSKFQRRIFLQQVSPVAKRRHAKQTSKNAGGYRPKLDFGWVPFVTLCITAFTAVLFGAGKAYRNAYLLQFGFSDVIFGWPFQDLVYIGIIKQLKALILVPSYFLLLALSPFLIREFRQILRVMGMWLEMKYGSTRMRHAQARGFGKFDSLIDAWKFIVFSSMAYGFFVFVSACLVVGAEQRGISDGQAAIQSTARQAAGAKLPYVIIERIVGGQKIVKEGYLVTCSERACGLYSSEKVAEKSEMVPLEGVLSFRYKSVL